MRIAICTFLLFSCALLFPTLIHGSCSVRIDPTENRISETTTIHLSITNIGDQSTNFVRIPNSLGSAFTPITASADGWELMLEGGGYAFINGSITPGSTQIFHVTGVTGSDQGSYPWVLQTSSQADGSDGQDCDTATLVLVSELAPTPTPEPTPTPTPAPNISNISVAAASSTAVITWRLDSSATGIVYYGVTSAYGNGVSTNPGESEQVNLTGLSPSTTYHYQIQVTNAGGTTIVTDNTFTTAAANVETVVTTTVTNVVTQTTTQTITNSVTKSVDKKVEIRDQTPPRATLTSELDTPFSTAPKIVGTATDDTGISLIDYSLDSGSNWLPVETIGAKAAKKTQFSFSPDALLDGNYDIKIRVTDLAGNIGFSATKTLVIDRLPPQVGPALWSVGPISLDGVVLVGTTARLSLSAIGGPTSITVAGEPLKKDSETGLWVGAITFSTVGDVSLDVTATDGAGSVVESKLNPITVIPNGSIGVKGTVSIYVLEPTMQRFALWDALPFGQQNPITTSDTGEFGLFIPPGTYYLEIEAPGKMMTRTRLFSIEKSTAINPILPLLLRSDWRPWRRVHEVEWTPNTPRQIRSESSGQSLPFFALRTSDDEIIYSNALRGQPTLLTFLTTWSPFTADQVAILEELADQKTYRTIAVFAQQPQSAVRIFKQRGGYRGQFLSDPDGILTASLQIFSIPTHVFLDRAGMVVRVVSGSLSQREILDIFNHY